MRPLVPLRSSVTATAKSLVLRTTAIAVPILVISCSSGSASQSAQQRAAVTSSGLSVSDKAERAAFAEETRQIVAKAALTHASTAELDSSERDFLATLASDDEAQEILLWIDQHLERTRAISAQMQLSPLETEDLINLTRQRSIAGAKVRHMISEYPGIIQGRTLPALVKEHLGVSVYTDDLAIVEAARIEHLLGPERYQIYLNVQEMLARDAEKTASKSN